MPTLPRFTTLGRGHTVLMLHGIGGGHLAFAPQVETLAGAGYRAVAWDMPGYGSSPPIEPYNFKGLADSCLTLIDALNPPDEPITLVGHSMGGMVAQEVVMRWPHRVSRLVLCGTSAAFGQRRDGQLDPAWAERFIQQRTAPLDAGLTMGALADTLVPQMVGPGALPEGLRLALRCMADVPPSTYRRAQQALVQFDRTAALREIGIPTLLLSGRFDRNAAPHAMQAMAEQIPNAWHTTLEGVGHLMNLEDPDAFDGALLAFLSETRP